MKFTLLFLIGACFTACAGPNVDRSRDGQMTNSNGTDTLTLGGGCFWCVEAIYERVQGVVSVSSGYAGGKVVDPTYQEVCSGKTGHAEVVQIIYDSTQISTVDLLNVFFSVHDPTTLNRQGNDIGTQYRSVVFYHTEEQRLVAENVIRALEEEGIYPQKIVTEILPHMPFYSAEKYHQDYFALNSKQPYCQVVIVPKVEKFEKLFKDLQKKY